MVCWRASPLTFKHHINHTKPVAGKRRRGRKEKKGQKSILSTSISAFLLLEPFTGIPFAG